VDTRPFVEFYDLAYVAAKRITPVSGEHVTHSQTEDGKGEYGAIHGIREACDTFLAADAFPASRGSIGPALREASLEEIGQTARVVEGMRAAL